MKWTPEPTPNAAVTRPVLVEWLKRSFDKLSQWSDGTVSKGYGGLFLSSSYTPGTPITLTQTFQKVTGFDTTVTDSPAGVSVDVPNDRIALLEPGVWQWNFLAVGQITPFTQNTAQTIELSAYNETKGQALLVGYQAVPRYSDTFDVSRTALRRNPGPLVETGDFLSVWIRQRQASPQITVNIVDELELTVFRVSG